ncbi:hypothetical protein VSDG_07783 [Cytospora chrysosperma]|uniref:Aminopeptidase n=1 Tax=Cytospora chrysosperma TaxID=252740 RepID=A0A423VJX4_CYTCH|nr:hypothetical protein VSDG_07783 [Valsa sordida]
MCRHAGASESSSAVNVAGRELLPANVVPTHYDLTLEPDLTKFTFDGTVIVDLDVAEDSKSISLHTLELDIHSTKVSSDGKVISDSPQISYDEKTQVSKIDFSDVIPKGSKAQLEIKFTGQLNDKMAGFYRSTYKKEDGTEGILATTQMEATDARRSFPCFDEPALKATFTVTLVADKNLTCLSNMDVASETEAHSGKKAVKFNKSPLMSTYLVAFIVGELNYIETNDFRVPVRVYAPPGQDIEHGRFSLNLAAKTLAFYEKVFGIEFPLPKMDQVAIPDFAQGAMENWGLITYRVVDLLLDEKSSGAATKERVAEVVQHELAHQWFGNLVTMDWWEGLWLNEGFATWASWYSCNAFYPEWKVWETFVTDSLQGGLALDSLRSSHPIEVPVKRADEINQIFDAISYMKGSCVLRMVSTYLGEDVFLEGVRKYLKKHAYGNTQTGDLWASLAEVSGKQVEEVMASWTKQIGFPVVTVSDSGSDAIHVKQNRFLRTGDVKPEEDQVLYPVLLGLRTKEGVDRSLILDKREADFKVPSTDFFKLNADHTSPYRTSYSPERLAKLGKAAKDGLLSVEDRAGMIADAGALAQSGYQKTSGVLSLLKGFDSETEFVVWNEIIARLTAMQGAWIFEDKAVRDGLENFQRSLVSSKAHAMGWQFSDNDGHVEQQFKAMLFGSAGLSGDEQIITAAKDMFSKYMAGDKNALHPNIRGSVFAMALKYGGKDEKYEKILDFYRTSKSSDERNTALRCLGRAKQPELIQQTLDLLFSGEIKDQDIYMPTAGLRSHPEGIEALFKWMVNNWDELYKRLPPALSMLGSMVQIMTSSFTKPEQLAQVEKFFADKNTSGYDQALAQSLDGVRSKISWLSRDKSDVAGWLKENGYGS